MNQEKSSVNSKILVVDDSSTNILLVEGLLSNEGYEVFSATSVNEALDMLKHELPDLIILDLMMPRVNGFHLLKKVKSNFRTKLIPVVILSAKTDHQSFEMAKSLGASEYFCKPVNISLFLKKVKQEIKQKGIQQV
jgi:PleD family two-component response regulator